jgi:hypothetical protein
MIFDMINFDVIKIGETKMKRLNSLKVRFKTCSHLDLIIDRKDGEESVYMNLSGLESETNREDSIDLSDISRGRDNEYVCLITKKPCALYSISSGHSDIPYLGPRCPSFELTSKNYMIEGRKYGHNLDAIKVRLISG